MIEYPKRPRSHQIESESESFFRSHLPAAWICERPSPDYGVDLHVHLVEEGSVLPHSLLVQLKASEEAAPGDSVPTKFKVSTYNLLWNRLEVALIVRYVASEKEAYWQLLKDVPAPKQEQETFTLRLPRANKISEHPWDHIAAYVQDIHRRKLAAIRRGR